MKTPKSLAELGFPITASRPSVLRRVPLRWVFFTSMGVLGFAVAFARTQDADDRLLVPAVGIATALATTLVTAAASRRREEYRHVASAVAELVNAWNRLRTTSGVTAAIETNLALLCEHAGAGGARLQPLGREVTAVERDLRAVEPLPRPARPDDYEDWRDNRYDQVALLNRRLVGLVSGHDEQQLRRTATTRAYKEVMDAYSEWDRAAQSARAAVLQWADLDDCVALTERYVRTWWVYAVNDPRYWETEPEQLAARARAHSDARDAVHALYSVIQHRDLGMHPLRARLASAVLGRPSLTAIARPATMP